MHYLDVGSGPPVLLLHAFPLSAGMWHPQIDALADRWRVIAPDLTPEQAQEPSVDAMADDVAELLKQLGIDQAVVVGLSMGGYVTLAFLRRHRPLVRAIVLADTRAGADTPEVRERRISQQDQVRGEGMAGLIDTMLGSLLSETTREQRPDVVAWARQLMEGVTPEHAIAALEAMKRRPDSTADLAGVNVPVLVLVGENDGPSPPSVAEDMARQLPDARLAVIPRSGHLSNLEDPETFNQELRSFLDRL